MTDVNRIAMEVKHLKKSLDVLKKEFSNKINNNKLHISDNVSEINTLDKTTTELSKVDLALSKRIDAADVRIAKLEQASTLYRNEINSLKLQHGALEQRLLKHERDQEKELDDLEKRLRAEIKAAQRG
ncbi:hypothetical protein LNKW23_37640 [Paralimibaculum aggregatum]|uniref:Uncharacterized protein n=1 Tax=Paralimibaculum aggregatum TaxID=3036245 RepID=A0ABQ6LRS7_9RHOB|nr:hypothetical protein [Limibaculum sp. NKW23]GMG84548.1 hypothetical protein LNKW23_37640 [Limibaculum sp. NKW23]